MRFGVSLLPGEEFQRIVGFLTAYEHYEFTYGSFAVDQMLAFLVAQKESGRELVPCEDVEVAWRAFIVHTDMYRRFCTEHVGEYVDYCPPRNKDVAEGRRHVECRVDPISGKYEAHAVDQNAVSAHYLSKSGFRVESKLWFPEIEKHWNQDMQEAVLKMIAEAVE